jgi:hypothetical protein
LLMRTGSLVKPIMKKHDWKVGTLAEVGSLLSLAHYRNSSHNHLNRL